MLQYFVPPVELNGRGEVCVDGDTRDGLAAHLRKELVHVKCEADGDQTAVSPTKRNASRAEEIPLPPEPVMSI